MKLAIMQPYFFPYIGYFQLINSVDKFVIYNDVNFIKGGWINRNHILSNGQKQLITIPLMKVSSNSLISNIDIQGGHYWKKKVLNTLDISYRKAPYFNRIYELIESVLMRDHITVDQLSTESIKSCCEHIGINTTIAISSLSNYENKHLKSESRVIDICKQEKCSVYINAIGGQDLYSYNTFFHNGIELKFIDSSSIEYVQFGKPFIPNLSIIDVMMFNDVDTIQKHLNEFELK